MSLFARCSYINTYTILSFTTACLANLFSVAVTELFYNISVCAGILCSSASACVLLQCTAHAMATYGWYIAYIIIFFACVQDHSAMFTKEGGECSHSCEPEYDVLFGERESWQKDLWSELGTFQLLAECSYQWAVELTAEKLIHRQAGCLRQYSFLSFYHDCVL